MHIPDGVLPLTVCAAGYASTGALTWLSLWRIKRLPDPHALVPRTALLTAVFFVAALVRVPLPPVSVHLILNGLLGVVLGWYALPAILVGLFFQAVLFQHGGLVSLGVNATLVGVPALLAGGVFRLRRLLPGPRRIVAGAAGFGAGAAGVGLAVLLLYGLLLATLPTHLDAATEQAALGALAVAHLPVVLLEGLLTALVVLFVQRVGPALLAGPGGGPLAESGEL